MTSTTVQILTQNAGSGALPALQRAAEVGGGGKRGGAGGGDGGRGLCGFGSVDGLVQVLHWWHGSVGYFST
jgi:hypothetical protein